MQIADKAKILFQLSNFRGQRSEERCCLESEQNPELKPPERLIPLNKGTFTLFPTVAGD